jgi:hypothetical protein
MTTITTTRPAGTAAATPARRRLRRGGAVLGAVAANGVLWSVGAAFGVDYRLSDSAGSAIIALPVALIATALFALLGWGALAVLERVSRRAQAIWTGLAVGVAALSEVPIFLEQATTGTRVALFILHAAVAAVLIPTFRASRR